MGSIFQQFNRRRSSLRQIGAVIIAVVGIAFSSASVQAGILSLGVDTADSSLSVKLTLTAALFGNSFSTSTPTVSDTLSGAAPPLNTIPPATTGFLGLLSVSGSSPGTPGQLNNEGGGFSLGNLSTTINGPTLPVFGTGSLGLLLVPPQVTIGPTGAMTPLSAGVGTGTYDFSGLPLTLSGGSFSFNSAGYLSFLGSNTLNFPTNFATLNLPSGAHGTLTLGIGPPNAQPATLTIPLAMTVPLLAVGNTSLAGATVNAIVSGTLVLTGINSVPEPGSVILLGIGFVLAMPMLWKRLRRG